MRRLLPALSLVALAACQPQDVDGPSQRARFADYPDLLFSALESVCSEPSDTFSRPVRDTVECRSYLAPDATAAIIVRYDGRLDALPQLVMQFRARADAPGYLVDYDTYLSVPQKTGAPLRVVQQSPTIAQRLEQVMRRAGGVPE